MLSMLKYRDVKLIELSDWNNLVSTTYGRQYCFQQQDGCKGRGIWGFRVPDYYDFPSDFENDSVPEVVNGPKMGVSFKAWISRDPNQPIPNQRYDWELRLFWERNFYPNIQMIINDLYSKKLLDAGEYVINIDW
jgi:hypothetical protein